MRPAPPVPLHLFTGKGGVGKTTLAAALALARAEEGARPILVELGHRSSLASVLGVPERAIGHRPSEVLPGLWASNVSLDEALTDYLARRMRSRTIARRVVSSRGLTTFFEAAPAVPELLTLEHVGTLLETFDPVLVDLDATGHALMFLELPALLGGLAPHGPIGELVRGLGAILADPARTRVHLVTLPSALPVEETRELATELTRRGSPLGTIFVNRRAERPLARGDDAPARALLGDASLEPDDREALVLALEDSARWDEEERDMESLLGLGPRRVVLGEVAHAGQSLGREALLSLGRRAREGLA